MSVARVIAFLNQMQAEGVVDRYAIGGAVGATFYLEPVATLDIAVFVAFAPQPGSRLVSTKPILDYVVSRGGALDGEYVIIEGWPVQFLPPTSPLVEEALDEAITMEVEGMLARVFLPEHLAAIALETGRAKDKARLLQFIEAGEIDAEPRH